MNTYLSIIILGGGDDIEARYNLSVGEGVRRKDNGSNLPGLCGDAACMQQNSELT